jgi:hypothetical protein
MSEQPTTRVSDQYTPRERLAAMIARAELDPDDYGQQIRENPEAALQRAGFSSDQVRGLLAQPKAAVDPAAGILGGGGGGQCSDTSCIISLCPGTCFVSIPAIPGVCNPGGGGGGGGGGCSLFTIF